MKRRVLVALLAALMSVTMAFGSAGVAFAADEGEEPAKEEEQAADAAAKAAEEEEKAARELNAELTQNLAEQQKQEEAAKETEGSCDEFTVDCEGPGGPAPPPPSE